MDSQDSQSTQQSSQGTENVSQEEREWDSDEEFEVERIVGSEIGDDDHVKYLVKWRGKSSRYSETLSAANGNPGWSSNDNTWEPLAKLENSLDKVEQFHRRHPDNPRYGPDDISHSLLDLSTLKDNSATDKSGDHIIYGHFLVDDSNGANSRLPPTVCCSYFRMSGDV